MTCLPPTLEKWGLSRGTCVFDHFIKHSQVLWYKPCLSTVSSMLWCSWWRILTVAPFTPPVAHMERLMKLIVAILTHSTLPGLIPHATDPLRKCCFKWKTLALFALPLMTSEPHAQSPFFSKNMVLHYKYQKEFANTSYTRHLRRVNARPIRRPGYGGGQIENYMNPRPKLSLRGCSGFLAATRHQDC